MRRFIAIVKGDKNSEAGLLPTEGEFRAMGAFNQRLAKDGTLEAGEGLHPTSKGARIHYENGKTTVTKGPFPEPKPFSGFWILHAKDLDDAVRIMRESPNPSRGPGEVEIRQIYSAEDFGQIATDDMKTQWAETEKIGKQLREQDVNHTINELEKNTKKNAGKK